MTALLGWLYFALIQVFSLGATLVGIPVVAALSAADAVIVRESQEYPDRMITAWKGGRLTWIWGNEEDGVDGPPWHNPTQNKWKTFTWSAFRNPSNNIRFLTSWKGGPWYQHRGNGWYVQLGFRPDTGWVVLSAGSGTGTVIP